MTEQEREGQGGGTPAEGEAQATPPAAESEAPAAPPPTEPIPTTPSEPAPAPAEGAAPPVAPSDAATPAAPAPAKPAAPAKAEAKAPERVPPPPDSIASVIATALPDVTLDAYQGASDIIIEISRDDVPKVMSVLKDDARLDLKFLRCLFGVDHSDEGMEVIYQLLSIEKGHDVVIKTKLPKDDLRVASVTSVWNAANWHERETRDMFGIDFEGHPHLVPLLLPEDMTDHFPLRKSNPLAEIDEWQGELLGEDVGQAGHIPTGSRFEGVGGDAGGEEE